VLALEVLCATQEKWELATDEIARLGFTIEMRNDRGQFVGIKRSPFVSIANMAQKELIKLYIQFGMTPSSRARISVVGEKQKDEWDDFLDS
jgi:P27 family predicted phage terminase small subunit